MPILRCLGQAGPFTVEPHPSFHADEIVAGWLIERFATADWHQRHPEPRLGQAGTAFDEHQCGSRPRRDEQSSATLTAASLGISDHPVLKVLLDETREHDLEGHPLQRTHDMYFGRFVDFVARKVFLDQDQRIWDWGMETLDAWYGLASLRRSLPDLEPRTGSPLLMANLARDVAFHYAHRPDRAAAWQAFVDEARAAEAKGLERAAEELAANAQVLTFEGYAGKDRRRIFKVAAIDSANPLLSKAFRLNGFDALIIFQPLSGGRQVNFQSFVKAGGRLSNRPVIEALRRAILSRQPLGAELAMRMTPDELRREEFLLPGDPFHYFQDKTQAILNGALSNRKVPPTPLDRQQVIDLHLASYRDQVEPNPQ